MSNVIFFDRTNMQEYRYLWSSFKIRMHDDWVIYWLINNRETEAGKTLHYNVGILHIFFIRKLCIKYGKSVLKIVEINKSTFKEPLLLQLQIPWVSLIKILNFNAETEQVQMSKLSQAKQKQMFQDTGHTKKYEAESGTMKAQKIPKARIEIK